MSSARQTIDVEVPPEEFFRVLQDYAAYPEFVPEVRAVRVNSREGNVVQVTYRLDLRIKQLEFTLRHVERPDELRIEWSLVKGELIRKDEGAWTLQRTATGTRATYAIELELASRAPAALQQALAQRGLPAMLANFKARAEKVGRERS